MIFTPGATLERDTASVRADTTPARKRVIGIGRDDKTPTRGRGIGIERADTTPERTCEPIATSTIGCRQPINSVDVTWDLDFKPRTSVRWKGKKAMTSNQFEAMRDGMRVNKRQKMPS